MIRDAVPLDDAARIAQIYNHYVLHDTATFEVEPVGEAAMAARMATVQGSGLPWIVTSDSLGVTGFAYAAPFRDREAYRYTLEVTVYLDRAETGRGLGSALYRELLRRVRAMPPGRHAPAHSLVAVIALPHPASVALHESLGFEHAGTVRQAGRKFDRWIDVGYWQYVTPGDNTLAPADETA